MTDTALRQAHRADPVAALAWRLRTDAITHERVAYAATLGHETALQVVEPAKLPRGPRTRTQCGAVLLSPIEAVRWATDLAELAVDRAWTDASDTRPADAIAAARAWADCPCEEHVTRVRVAAHAAWSVNISRSARAAAEAAARAGFAAFATAVPAEATATKKKKKMAATTAVMWAADAAVKSGAITWDEVFASLAERLV